MKAFDENDINVIMEDGGTRSEAIDSLKRGATVFETPEEWIESLKDCDCYENETIEEAREGYYSGISVVTYQNHEYLIEYCL